MSEAKHDEWTILSAQAIKHLAETSEDIRRQYACAVAIMGNDDPEVDAGIRRLYGGLLSFEAGVAAGRIMATITFVAPEEKP